jgi:hypothetical protein
VHDDVHADQKRKVNVYKTILQAYHDCKVDNAGTVEGEYDHLTRVFLDTLIIAFDGSQGSAAAQSLR